MFGRDSDPIRAFERRLGYRFRKRSLLMEALTHRSYANEHGLDENYERLEFLGDAVLGLVAADWLSSLFPDRPEGDLSKNMSYLVSETVLEEFARDIDLGPVLRLGVGEDRSGGREKKSLLADSMEAIFGAIFTDGGFKAADRVLRPMLEKAMDTTSTRDYADAKTRLQEEAQARGWDLPVYLHVDEDGPDHQKRFRVECWLREEILGTGEGHTKKIAEQQAAAVALRRLEEL